MPNQLNKNKNKLKEKDEIRTEQQAERQRRFQKIANGHRSAEELLEETQQWVELVEEAREEFLNLYFPREENPDGRELARTARSAKGARAWSELFVRDTLPERTDSLNGDPSSPKSTTTGIQSVGAGVRTVGIEIQSVGVGVQTIGIGIQSVGVEMARPKEKLPKLMVMEQSIRSNIVKHAKQFGGRMT